MDFLCAHSGSKLWFVFRFNSYYTTLYTNSFNCCHDTDKTGSSTKVVEENLIPSLIYAAKNLDFTLKTYGLLPNASDTISSRDMDNYSDFRYVCKK